ncbi:unnamed protein product [Thelazia callipaeda]|uniref:Secreted protein n=1 Tax=Thelazia callipaeda TaxID=103827 RepID=A0A0N5CKP8_THECL|nr:unnamed protein product [Thelazia callipaeda]
MIRKAVFVMDIIVILLAVAISRTEAQTTNNPFSTNTITVPKTFLEELRTKLREKNLLIEPDMTSKDDGGLLEMYNAVDTGHDNMDGIERAN